MADGGDKRPTPPDDEEAPDGAPQTARLSAGAEDDPPGDPEQPVETVVRYETETERGERLREERSHRRHRRITEAGVALAALFVSLSVFMINGLLYMRGSDVTVLDPEAVVLYRDTGPNGSSMFLAIQAQIINAASGDYGDVAKRASVAIGPKRHQRGAFEYTALVEPTMSRDPEKAAANCPQGARCITNTGFLAIERPRKLLDIPGGASRSEYLAFMIEAQQCEGEQPFCETFHGFDDAVSHLRAQTQPVIRMTLEFHFDGEETVQCRLPADPATRKAVFDYLVEKGWAEVECERPTKR